MTVSVYADPSGDYATMSIGGSEKFRLNSDGTATLGGVPVQRMLTLGTEVTTSGTNVDFTGIPSWAKKITVMFDSVSTNGSAMVLVQIGTTSGVETSGYNGATTWFNASSLGTSVTSVGAAWNLTGGNGSRSGLITFVKVSGNTWTYQGVGADLGGSSNTTLLLAGSKILSGVVDRVRITTTNGTDAFDAGSISVCVEG